MSGFATLQQFLSTAYDIQSDITNISFKLSINIINRVEPKFDPCGTPKLARYSMEETLLQYKRCLLSFTW